MFKNIVIPIDLSDKQSIRVVTPTALNLAKQFSSSLHLIHIVPNFGITLVEDYLPRNWMKEQKRKNYALLENLAKQYIPKEISVEISIRRGAIYDEIINYSEKVGADLIMVSAVRPELKDYMLGPNASSIVRHSSISVMVVRD